MLQVLDGDAIRHEVVQDIKYTNELVRVILGLDTPGSVNAQEHHALIRMVRTGMDDYFQGSFAVPAGDWVLENSSSLHTWSFQGEVQLSINQDIRGVLIRTESGSVLGGVSLPETLVAGPQNRIKVSIQLNYQIESGTISGTTQGNEVSYEVYKTPENKIMPATLENTVILEDVGGIEHIVDIHDITENSWDTFGGLWPMQVLKYSFTLGEAIIVQKIKLLDTSEGQRALSVTVDPPEALAVGEHQVSNLLIWTWER